MDKIVFVIWEWPDIIGIFESEEDAIYICRRRAHLAGLKEIFCLETGLPYWVHPDVKGSIVIEKTPMNEELK